MTKKSQILLDNNIVRPITSKDPRHNHRKAYFWDYLHDHPASNGAADYIISPFALIEFLGISHKKMARPTICKFESAIPIVERLKVIADIAISHYKSLPELTCNELYKAAVRQYKYSDRSRFTKEYFSKIVFPCAKSKSFNDNIIRSLSFDFITSLRHEHLGKIKKTLLATNLYAESSSELYQICLEQQIVKDTLEIKALGYNALVPRGLNCLMERLAVSKQVAKSFTFETKENLLDIDLIDSSIFGFPQPNPKQIICFTADPDPDQIRNRKHATLELVQDFITMIRRDLPTSKVPEICESPIIVLDLTGTRNPLEI